MNDPLLTPVPPAANVINDWRKVLTLIASRSADVRIADLEITRAEGLRRQALGRALPAADATASVAQSIIPSEQKTLDASTGAIKTETSTPTARVQLTISQPVLAPQLWHGIKTASLGIDSARYSADDRRRVVLAVVASAIVAVVTAERVAEINRVGLKSALERLELTERRARLGTGTKLDVVRAQQDATLARGQIVQGDAGLLQARESLGLSLGSSEAYGVQPSISINEIEQTMKATCTPGRADQRSDVLAAQVDREIAERRITEAKLGFLPTAQVSTTLAYSSEASGLNDNHGSWSIQGVLSIPIWDGGSRYGEIKSAKAGAEESKLRHEATLRSAEIDVTQAMRGVVVAEQARALSEQTRDLARETARLSQVAFEAGTGTSFDLVESGRRQREAELDLAVREFELIKAKLSALLATANCTY